MTLSQNVSKKKILLFAPRFFGYENSIIKALSLAGAHVTFFDERPVSSSIGKAYLRLGLPRLKFIFSRYYQSVLDNSADIVFDFVLFVNPECSPHWFLSALKLRQPQAKFILYFWDSFKNKPNALMLRPYFHRAYSFDRSDCSKYPWLTFLPLFHSHSLHEHNPMPIKSGCDFDVAFFGTTHGDRIKIALEVLQECKRLNLRSFFFLFAQGGMMKRVRELLHFPTLRRAGFSISATPLSQQAIIDIISKSNAILDIQHPNQSGLTMRTFETLFLNRKLITTNKSIVDYEFYSKQHVKIISRTKPCLSHDFFEDKASLLTNSMVDKYSINSWLTQLLCAPSGRPTP